LIALETIRSAMLDGYREAGFSRTVAQFHDNYECYALLNFEDWFDQVGAAFDVTSEQREEAAATLRSRVIERVNNSL
jgi:hypothetical protein